MDAKKTPQKKTRRKTRAKAAKKPTRKPRAKAPKKRVETVAELQAKIEREGAGALTFDEIAKYEKIERIKRRRKRSDLTMAELEALAKEGRITTAQIKELSEMRQALDQKAARSTIRPVLTIRERLESIQSDILDALIEELTNGRGIARITAAERLKAWSKEEGVGANEGADEEISFTNPLSSVDCEREDEETGAA